MYSIASMLLIWVCAFYLGSRSRGIVSYPEFWVKLIVYLEGRLGTSVGRYAGDTWCSGNTAGVVLVL